jgi:hypothetical protein
MKFKFSNQMIEWRGPAPFYYVPVPQDLSDRIKANANLLTYGWGVIPVKGCVGKTEFTTSLFPRNGIYLVPIKNMVRLPEKLELGQHVTVELELNL